MNMLVSGAMLMLVTAGGHPTQTAPVSETIALHHLDAKNVPGLLPATQGLQNIVVNYRDNSVSVRGDAAAIKAAKAKILALDVQPVSFCISATLVRYQIGADGHYSEAVVMSPTMITLEKMPARMSVTSLHEARGASELLRSGVAMQFTPAYNADGSITLLAETQELGEQGEVVRSGRNERRIKPGETAHVVGMTDATDNALRRRVMQGEVVRSAGAYTGYYVQAHAERLDENGHLVKPQP